MASGGDNVMTPDKIRDLRRRLGLSQAQLAARINAVGPGLRVHRHAVSRWESGRVQPSGPSLAAIRTVACDEAPALRREQAPTEGDLRPIPAAAPA